MIEIKSEIRSLCDIEIVNEMDLVDLTHILECYCQWKENEYVGRLGDFTHLGSGTYGIVYGYKNFAIKRIKERSLKGVNEDATILKELSHLDFIPKLYAVIDDSLIIMERIEGDTVDWHHMSRENFLKLDYRIIDSFEDKLYEIYNSGWIPNDLHEGNVMICEKTRDIKIIDVGAFYKRIPSYDYDEFVEMNDAMDWVGDKLKDIISI